MWRKRHNRPYSINLNLAKEKVFLMQKRKNLYCSTWFIQIIYELHLNEGFMNKYRTYHSFLPPKNSQRWNILLHDFHSDFHCQSILFKIPMKWEKRGESPNWLQFAHFSNIFRTESMTTSTCPTSVLLSNIISLSGTRAAAKRRPSVTITYNQRHFTYNSHELLYDVWKDFFFPNVSPSQTN